MKYAFMIALGVPALAMAPAASATVLVSNLDEPVRATTQIDNGLWAAQSFYNDGTSSQLVSIRTMLGAAFDAPDAFAELRLGSTSGLVLASFAMPSLTGAISARTLSPLATVMLAPGEKYFLILGVSGGGGFGWSYAEGNAFTGTGAFGNYEYSTDQAASWTNFGGANPYLMEVNVIAGAVPEPGAWALMIAGFGLAGAAMRRSRISRTRLAVTF